MNYVQFEKLSLKTDPVLTEKWVQDRIAENPAILGLGDLILKDKERIQPKAGRLDLLLQDVEANRRYEVEIQLGSTDETHIIRTIEYWDIERKRYPQYEHTAVIVAENITSRFLNVISLFNGAIPLVAIQMSALKVADHVGLVFTKVLDYMPLGLDEEEEDEEPADRTYWENRGSKATLTLADQLLALTKKHDQKLELSYKKRYIGLAKDGQPCNFVQFRPQKAVLRFEPRLPATDATQDLIEKASLDSMGYDNRWGRYRIRLQQSDIDTNRQVIEELIAQAYKYANED